MMKLATVADNRDAKSSHHFISFIINSKQFIQRSSGPWNKLQNIHHTLWWWDHSWSKSGPWIVYHIGKRLRWWPNIGAESRVLLNRAAEAGDAIPLSPYSLLPTPNPNQSWLCPTICTAPHYAPDRNVVLLYHHVLFLCSLKVQASLMLPNVQHVSEWKVVCGWKCASRECSVEMCWQRVCTE